MDAMDEIKQTFFQECEDLLEEMETGLNDMSDGEGDSETVNAVFRAVHSIKGGAGAFGLNDLVSFAHVFETTLDEIRSDRLEASHDVMNLLLRSADRLADLVTGARDDIPADLEVSKVLIEELSAAAGIADDAPEDAAPAAELEFEPLSLDISLDDDDDFDLGEDPAKAFIVKFKPTSELYANANETVLLLRSLAEHGDIEVECDTSDLPMLDELDPEGAYLSWTIEIRTESDETALQNVFEFVEGCCELNIAPQDSDDDDDDVVEPSTSSMDGEDEPDTISEEDQEMAETPIELVVNEASVGEENPTPTAPTASAAEANTATASKSSSSPDSTIRVSLGRVDRLVNLVGELVINQAMVAQGVIDAGLERDDNVEQGLEELKQLTREIQESVMAIRAQPVKALFQRMSRIVRQAANATEKTVRLVTEGEMTEVDKTVVERLADPLTHMIRNAVDHGLETPEKRIASGKSAEGIVSLTAAHRSGRVIITVSDDGAGINRERVKQIAVEKGLVPEDAQLTDSEIDNLLFMPGFSTVEHVSNLSGRGVGMDVVKRAIQSVGGKISISSQPGKGSTFSISLPLTLAVVDGMVTEVAGQTLVVPLTAIVETLKPELSDIHEIGDGGRVISIRGEFIPLIDVGLSMGYRKELTDLEEAVVLSIETEDQERLALLVDGIHDQRQVVIKSLEENYGHVSGVAAATILGDGQIALILDTDDIANKMDGAKSSQQTQLAAVG
ncbi:MAG: chemotaxis protein CheA [Alphaproteobacteria bacterium]|nr:chemotaxis protein CheA [Alphaproteobacteria bacterium]